MMCYSGKIPWRYSILSSLKNEAMLFLMEELPIKPCINWLPFMYKVYVLEFFVVTEIQENEN